jgi:hypothetical protein
MKKIRLDVDSLDVLSFETESMPLSGRGTVQGLFRPGMTVEWADTECRELSPTWEHTCGCAETEGDECATLVTCLTCLGVTCYLHGCGPADTTGEIS